MENYIFKSEENVPARETYSSHILNTPAGFVSDIASEDISRGFVLFPDLRKKRMSELRIEDKTR
jgi:hypothetical protein